MRPERTRIIFALNSEYMHYVRMAMKADNATTLSKWIRGILSAYIAQRLDIPYSVIAKSYKREAYGEGKMRA